MANSAPPPPSSPPRGLLIVFEGLDRSGKSTQCTLLYEHLLAAGHKVQHLRFPDRTTPTGTIISSYLSSSGPSLSDHAIHLLFSANRWEAAPSMLAALNAGTTLLVDRYSYSGAVYSAAKQNPELGLEWAWAPEVGLPEPHLVLYLTVDESVQMKRGGFGAERYEKVEMQREVRRLFDALFGRLKKDVKVISAEGTVEQVHGLVREQAEGILRREERSRQIGRLGPLA